jgi:hypothetical protein
LFEERGIDALNQAALWFIYAEEAIYPRLEDWADDGWGKLLRELRDQPRDHQWSVWLGWYDDILHGRSELNRDIEFARLFGHPDAEVEITEVAWKAGPSVVNPKIRQVLDWFEKQQLPEVPEQRPGLGFELNADGKIDVANTGLPDADDLSELEGIQPLLIDAIDDLIASCEGTNTFAHIARIAQQYKSVFEMQIERTSIDRMYGYGLRLDNANTHLKKDIEEGTLPDTSITIGEALDSVIALHGTSVLSTKRGQELLARSREYNRSRGDDLAYKERARAFAEQFSRAGGISTKQARDELSETIEGMGVGRFPERSSEQGRTVLFNLLAKTGSVLAKMGPAMLFITGGVVAQGVIDSVPGHLAAGLITEFANNVWSFWMANKALLRDLAAASGHELSWVNSLLNLMERKHESDSGLAVTIDITDLQLIDGVGPKLERTLKGLGYSTLEHVANWSESESHRVDELLRFKGRIQRERWVEQARALLAGSVRSG